MMLFVLWYRNLIAWTIENMIRSEWNRLVQSTAVLKWWYFWGKISLRHGLPFPTPNVNPPPNKQKWLFWKYPDSVQLHLHFVGSCFCGLCLLFLFLFPACKFFFFFRNLLLSLNHCNTVCDVFCMISESFIKRAPVIAPRGFAWNAGCSITAVNCFVSFFLVE